MKLEQAPQDVSLSSDFEQRDVAIGDVAFILDLFADKIYTHKERAVIRELACNAHDSHIVAGTEDVPFKVHLPTALEPWFSIRDYGTGLEDEDIANVYGAIGVSTKRESNELIGAFGVGSLSPYAMCDSFTVKSYLNGIVRTYQCMRDEKRQPKVIPLGSAPTNEANGLEIKLTVDGRIIEFENEAENVFSFWEGTLPEINNQDVVKKCEFERSKYIFQGDDFALTQFYGDMYALMGNIAYKIPYELDEFNCQGYLKFEIGELDFDTARENLSMTDKVKEKIRDKFAKVKQSISDIAIKRIEEKETAFERATLAEKLSSGQLGRYIGRDKLQEYFLPKTAQPLRYWQKRYGGTEKFMSRTVSAEGNNRYFIHKDRMETRIRSLMKDVSSRDFTLYVFQDMQQALDVGIPAELIEDLEDLPRPIRSYNKSATSKVKTFEFNMINCSKYDHKEWWKETEVDIDTNEIVYVEINRWKPVDGSYYISHSNSQIFMTLDVFDKYDIPVPKVVGLKTSFLKSKSFKNGNFISLDAYTRREFAKIAPSSYSEYNQKELEKIETIAKHVKNNDMVNEILSSCSNEKNMHDQSIAEICGKIGAIVPEMTKDLRLQDLMDAFWNKYSMLTLLHEYQINANPGIIIQYLEGGECPTPS